MDAILKAITKWYLRNFKVISINEAKSLQLTHYKNIFGDEISHLNCRSIWKDEKARNYRVNEIYYRQTDGF